MTGLYVGWLGGLPQGTGLTDIPASATTWDIMADVPLLLTWPVALDTSLYLYLD